MKLPSYREALDMGKEAVSKMLIPAKVAKARKQAELEMCKIDEGIAIKENSLGEVCTGETIDFKAIIKLQDEVALLKRQKDQYQQILDEMFPIEK